jgi:hypothetical protein
LLKGIFHQIKPRQKIVSVYPQPRGIAVSDKFTEARSACLTRAAENPNLTRIDYKV